MQKAKYDIGEEAVHRFSLSYEDRATLTLAEWVDDTFKKASVSIVLISLRLLLFYFGCPVFCYTSISFPCMVEHYWHASSISWVRLDLLVITKELF